MVEAIVWVMLVCNSDILLLKRPLENTGDNKDFEYSLVGGHVEKNESLLDAAVREVQEETGVKLDKQLLKLQHVIDRKYRNFHKVHFFFLVTGEQCNNNVYNKEPEKHYELKWANMEALPSEMGPLAKRAIQSLQNHENYSSYGWE